MKLLLTVLTALSLSACQITPVVDTAADIIFASDKIDTIQTELGEFSSNQEALKELDSLQSDIKNTLTTGGDLFAVESYHARALMIYATLKGEVKSKWALLSVEQKASIIALDNELIEVNANIVAMKNSVSVKDDILELIYRATILMSYYKGV